MDEQEMAECAMAHAKAQKNSVVASATDNFSAEESPISIFMAGSPGAGKTEVSKDFLKQLTPIIRIDADELRNQFKGCGYNGANSHVFQRAATRLVHCLHTAALKKGISFLLDGTFASESLAKETSADH